MTVYALTHTMFGGFHRNAQTKSLGTFATKDGVESELQAHRRALAKHDHLEITDHPDGRGFTYASTLGSMSFVPGSYEYKEEEVRP